MLVKPFLCLTFTVLLITVSGCQTKYSRDKDAGQPDASLEAGSTDSDTDADTDTDSDTDSDDDCAGVGEHATNSLSPVDIIITVDNSGSMTDEIVFVQENLNSFSKQIADAGINSQILMISADSTDSNGICVDEPLGSGSCPDDSNEPEYNHLPWEVASSNSLIILSTMYNQWKSYLRDNSVRHIIVVTDDNSMPFATANWFITAMEKKDPPFDRFTFHAIASSLNPDEACDQDPPHACCTLSASRGTVYEKLVDLTGGILGDLCEQDFQPVFDEVAKKVADVPIACEWVIPPPPNDQILDKEKVNVEFTDGEGETHEIYYVESKSDCEKTEEHAWYYDDPVHPEKIFACPDTCEWIQSDLNAQIEIMFGCKRKPAPVE